VDNPPTKIFLKWTSRAIDYKSNAFVHRNSLNMKWVWSEVKWVWNGRYSEQSSTWNADCTTPNQRVSFLPNVISSACSSNHFAVHSFSRTPERKWFLLEQATALKIWKVPDFLWQTTWCLEIPRGFGLYPRDCPRGHHSTIGAIPSELKKWAVVHLWVICLLRGVLADRGHERENASNCCLPH